MHMTQRLIEIANKGDQREKIANYDSILDDIFNKLRIYASDQNKKRDSLNECKEFLTHIVHESIPLVISRHCVVEFLNKLNQIRSESLVESTSSSHGGLGLNSDDQKEILRFALDCTMERSVPFEEQIALIREIMADLLEQEEEWTEAARMLQGITLDSGHRQISDDYKLQIYNQIIRLYLEDEDDISAEAYLNRMGHLMHHCTRQELVLQYKASQARVLDFKKQFLPASQKYFELSLVMDMHESERLAALTQAMICVLLASAGPQRNKMLTILFKDERSRQVENPVLFPMLEKMYLGRMVQKQNVEEFANLLRPHQLARLSDSSTVLDRAVMEHNILAASKVYRDISLAGLGHLLFISSDQAESIVGQMIGENRLQGVIDGIDQIVYFQRSTDEISRFDSQVTHLCHELDQIVMSVTATI